MTSPIGSAISSAATAGTRPQSVQDVINQMKASEAGGPNGEGAATIGRDAFTHRLGELHVSTSEANAAFSKFDQDHNNALSDAEATAAINQIFAQQAAGQAPASSSGPTAPSQAQLDQAKSDLAQLNQDRAALAKVEERESGLAPDIIKASQPLEKDLAKFQADTKGFTSDQMASITVGEPLPTDVSARVAQLSKQVRDDEANAHAIEDNAPAGKDVSKQIKAAQAQTQKDEGDLRAVEKQFGINGTEERQIVATAEAPAHHGNVRAE